MMTGWTLRPTMSDDEEFLWLMLFYAAHSEDEPGVSPEDVRVNPDLVGYIEGWRQGGEVGVVAEIGAEPVGAAWLRLMTEVDHANPVFMGLDTPELAVAVVPVNQRRGIGTGMILAVVEEARGRYPSVVLSARADSPAVQLYRRLGFTVVEEITNRVGTRSLKMAVDLRDGPTSLGSKG